MAKELGRSVSTISRELKRNVTARGTYKAVQAQYRYLHQRKKCRRPLKLTQNDALLGYLKTKLELKWSPEQIANTLTREYPWQRAMRISYETIYAFIYRDKREGGTLFSHLRQAHRTRRRRGNSKGKRGQIVDRVSIDLRPDGANNRSRSGHWEGDTVIGKNHQGGMVTLTERKNGFLLAMPIANRKSETVNRAIVHAYAQIPQHLRRTLTLDNGLEFAGFKTLEKLLGFTVYFAAPYSPWQRGSNENTNGLLRQYFPKGTVLTNLTTHDLNIVVQNINNRPRKRLDYRTPAQLMSVALRT